MLSIDLGSNTLRIVQFDCQSKKRVNAYEKIVRTAKDLHLTGEISQSSQNAIFDALEEASKLFDFVHEKCFCVTTEAMRQARNAKAIIEHIAIRFGLHFEIISGEREAFLTSLAIENALQQHHFDHTTYALFDLGGGSTEITLCLNGVKKSQSFPFGIVSTAEQFSLNLSKKVTELTAQVIPFLQNEGVISEKYLQLVTTAGTPTTVAAFLQGLDYEHYDYQKVNGMTLHVKDFDDAFGALTKMEPHEAERYTGTNRRDLVIVGILLVKELMSKLGFQSCIVMDDGLREGVALYHCNHS